MLHQKRKSSTKVLLFLFSNILQPLKTWAICVPHCVPSSLSVGPRKTVGTANSPGALGSGFPYALSQLQILEYTKKRNSVPSYSDWVRKHRADRSIE